MANRREKLDNSDPFGPRRRSGIPEGPLPSLSDLTNAMLTPAAPLTPEGQPAPPNTLDIFLIQPDPVQPRRAIPSLVRDGWDGSPHTLAEVFTHWIDAYASEVRSDYDSAERTLRHMLDGLDTRRSREDGAEVAGPVESSLFRLVDLAASIRREGLINPITVEAMETLPRSYRIETGERRWLAHHLLYSLTRDEAYRQIRAHVTEGVNVWKQAYENNARDNLNAIGKARQFATLLMDLHQRQGVGFRPFEDFGQEQDFYAQVADSSRFDVPRGSAEAIITAMGVTNRSVTTRYRNLLKLPYPVWLAADDLNWPERRLRKLTALNSRDALRLAAQWAQAEGYTHPLLPMGNTPPKAAQSTPTDDLHNTLEASKRSIERKLKRVNKRQAQALIEAYEAWLQDLKAGL